MSVTVKTAFNPVMTCNFCLSERLAIKASKASKFTLFSSTSNIPMHLMPAYGMTADSCCFNSGYQSSCQSNGLRPHLSKNLTYQQPILNPKTLTKPPLQAGFTLVEIVVVVVILSIFAGMMSLSVGSSESRKNRAFYEHLTDSLSYVRLLSAERMQPMGLRLQADKQGQITPIIVTLSNPYLTYQTDTASNTSNATAKNAMELSAMSGSTADDAQTPSWDAESEVTLPELPAGVSLSIQSLDAGNITRHANGSAEIRTLQPWFTDQSVPQVLWFGTGQATPVTIEVRHDSRLVGEVITIMPDGSLSIGQGL